METETSSETTEIIKIELILTWTRVVGSCEKWSNSKHIWKGFPADDELDRRVEEKEYIKGRDS